MDVVSATYTPREVSRTAFAYVDSNEGLGAGLKHGINQVCICCKAGSMADGQAVGQVDRLIEPLDLKPWTDFYISGKNEYAAYKCNSCGYQWSWHRAKHA